MERAELNYPRLEGEGFMLVKHSADWKSAGVMASIAESPELQLPAHDRCAIISRTFPSP